MVYGCECRNALIPCPPAPRGAGWGGARSGTAHRLFLAHRQGEGTVTTTEDVETITRGIELITSGVELIVKEDPVYDFRNIDIAIKVPSEPETVAALLKRGWRLKEDGLMHNRPFKRMSPASSTRSKDYQNAQSR